MSLKKKKARPMSMDELKQGRFLDLVSKQFLVKEISKDGHCLFAAFAAGIKRVIGEDVTVKSLRSKVADFLLSSKGHVPGMVYAQFTQLSDGSIVTDPSASLQIVRNIGHAPITLEQYAAKVRKDLYGGDLEIATLACVFQVSIHVYSWIYFNDSNIFQPEYYGSGQQHVALLFQQDFSSAKGAQDHYDLIVADQFWKWRKCMNAMPVWKKDLGICNSLKGRGIQALRDFEPDEVLLWYDGHRIDTVGNLVFARPSITELFQRFNLHYDSVDFQDTHAVRLGRRQSMDVLIDGYPLCDPCFDDELWVGRGALANSGSPQESNMKLIWVEAPDLPPDPIDNLRNCEAILVARRRIRYVFVMPS